MALNKKTIVIYVVLVIIFSTPFSVFAQQPTTEVRTFQKPTITLIADVNLQNCTYMQSASTNQTVHISCDITNKLGEQGDVRYGVQLLKRVAGIQEVVDTRVYDQVLSFLADQTVRQQIDYIPPGYLSGEYELWGLLRTSDGLALATNFLGKVTLKATETSYLEIRSNTCSLHVKGDTGTTTYNISQGVDIDASEILEGTCIVEAHAMGDVTAIPSFTTHRRSIFGEVVPDTKDVQKPFIFKTNEVKEISFVLPKALIPQAYDVVLSLSSLGGGVISNEVAIHYVLRGASATIQNILLDKDYYTAGDTAHVSVFWTGSADSFVGARKQKTADRIKSIAVSLKDDNDNSCAKESTFVVSVNEIDRSKLTDYPLSVMQPCRNPHVTIKILDDTGIVLTQKTVALASGEGSGGVAKGGFLEQRTILYFFVILFVAIAYTSLFIMRKKKIHEIL